MCVRAYKYKDWLIDWLTGWYVGFTYVSKDMPPPSSSSTSSQCWRNLCMFRLNRFECGENAIFPFVCLFVHRCWWSWAFFSICASNGLSVGRSRASHVSQSSIRKLMSLQISGLYFWNGICNSLSIWKCVCVCRSVRNRLSGQSLSLTIHNIDKWYSQQAVVYGFHGRL